MVDYVHIKNPDLLPNPFESTLITIDFEIDDSSEPDDQIKDEPTTKKKKSIESILFVDDEKDVRILFRQALEMFGYRVEVACDGKEAIDLYRRNPFDLIITDIFMPKVDGHTMMIKILRDFPDAKIFAITGYKSFDSDLELDMAKSIGALRTFYKPCKIKDIIAAIKEIDSI